MPLCSVLLLSVSGLVGCGAEVEDHSTQIALDPAVTEAIRASLLNLASDEDDVVHAAITSLANTGDNRVEELLEFYRQGSLYVWEDGDANQRVVLCEEIIENDDFDEFAPLRDALASPDGTYSIIPDDGTSENIEGADLPPNQMVVSLMDLEEIDPGRKERRWALSAKFLTRLYSPDRNVRLSGAKKCGDPPLMVDAIEHLNELG